jgi:uncharacterized membrane protein
MGRTSRGWEVGVIGSKSEQAIERPAAMVYDLAVDVLRHPEWMNVLDARVVSGDPTKVGARASEHMKVGPRTYDVEFEVASADPGQRVTWRVLRGGPFTGEITLELEPLEPGRTRASYSGRIEMKGMWRLLEPLIAREVIADQARELVRLKTLAEKQPTSAT